MARNPSCTVYVGNLDEKVTDRILYEILIQVGRVVDLYLPCDKETNHHKGYAFVEYESEEIANYAVRLFSGLVRLYNRTLKFAISGQHMPAQNTGTSVRPKGNTTPVPKPHSVHGRDAFPGSAQSTNSMVAAYTQPSENTGTPVTPKVHSISVPKLLSVREREVLHGSACSTDSRVSVYTHSATLVTPKPYTPHLTRPCPPHVREMATLHDSPYSANCRVSAYTHSLSPGYPQASARGFVDNGVISSKFDYSRRAFGSTAMNVNHSGSQHPIIYPSFLQQS